MDTATLLKEVTAALTRLKTIEDAMGGATTSKRQTATGTRKPMSKAARKKIAAAQRKRWKKYHAEQKKAA